MKLPIMKLIDSLYTIIDSNLENSSCHYTVRLNPEHFIYAAHFPGEPITPGVCIMQTGIELMEKACGLPLELECARNVKFLKVISPSEITVVCYSLDRFIVEQDRVSCQISVTAEGILYAKLSLVCRISGRVR